MFHKARLKLTAWYLLIIMIISVTFSVVLYKVLITEVERFDRQQRARIERRFLAGLYYQGEGQGRDLVSPQLLANPELISEIKQHILLMLISINTVVIGLAGIFGYLLAGRTLKPIKEMVDEQNRFVSDASHELRTPLTALKSAFEVYLRETKPTLAESKQLVGESLTDVNKLQVLSESLLQLAQYQQPNRQIPFEKLSLTQVITEAVKKTSTLAKKKNITILTPDIDINISGSTYKLVDLFVILLDNAIKYSQDNSKIDVSMKKFDSGIVISVKDTGIGIAKKDIAHIFERFYRVDQARSKSNESGYGLGLAIASQIVASHHGTISVKSKLHEGTEFIIKLPINARG